MYLPEWGHANKCAYVWECAGKGAMELSIYLSSESYIFRESFILENHKIGT